MLRSQFRNFLLSGISLLFPAHEEKGALRRKYPCNLCRKVELTVLRRSCRHEVTQARIEWQVIERATTWCDGEGPTSVSGDTADLGKDVHRCIERLPRRRCDEFEGRRVVLQHRELEHYLL